MDGLPLPPSHVRGYRQHNGMYHRHAGPGRHAGGYWTSLLIPSIQLEKTNRKIVLTVLVAQPTRRCLFTQAIAAASASPELVVSVSLSANGFIQGFRHITFSHAGSRENANTKYPFCAPDQALTAFR